MGTNRSSETQDFAAYLRSQRTQTQAQVDKVTRAHDWQDDVLDLVPPR